MGTGIFFHTQHFGSYRDGGSWTISEATLVYDRSEFAHDQLDKPHFTWGRDNDVERVAVQVISAVEWLPDPARPDTRPDGGKPVVISHREPLVRFCADGRLQRLRLVAYGGQIAGIGYQLVDVGPYGAEPNKSELGFLNAFDRAEVLA
jgi:hypothetical protein